MIDPWVRSLADRLPAELPLAVAVRHRMRNDAGLAAATAAAVVGQGLRADVGWRCCGSDDFAHYSHTLPSLMLFLGVVQARPVGPAWPAPPRLRTTR